VFPKTGVRSFLINSCFAFLAVWFSVGTLFAQNQTTTATEKLAVLSETLSAADIEKIRSLIDSGADVNVTNTNGVTPLYVALHKGHTEVVKLLLAANADVNAASKKGKTPLDIASQKGHTEIVELLMFPQEKQRKQ